MPEETGWTAVKRTWSDRRRWLDILLGAAPSLVFVIVAGAWSLGPAIVAAAVTALGGLGFRLVSHESSRAALIGVVVVALGAGVAAFTGQARGFFLLPTLVPFAVILVCLGTLIVRRPLTGLLLNRVTGGPADWPRHRRLFRIHLAATGAAIGINAVNGAIQVVCYGRGDTLALTVAHAATGPVFATLVAVTVVAARREISARAGRPAVPAAR